MKAAQQHGKHLLDGGLQEGKDLWVKADGTLTWDQPSGDNCLGKIYYGYGSYWFRFSRQPSMGSSGISGTKQTVLGFIACYVLYGLN